MKTLTDVSDCTVKVECLPEDAAIEGNASAIDEDTDAECIAWIKAELASGNEWAWCTIKVTVDYRGILGATDYLGCCSYKSEAQFREDGYFDDMVRGCLAEINAKLAKLAA